MESQRLDLGVVQHLTAESFGEPGHRTFRLRAETAGGNVSFWLEKEQLVLLGSALEELLGRIPDSMGHAESDDAVPGFHGELELQLGSLEVAFDGGRQAFSMEASDFESPLGLESIALYANRAQLLAVAEEIREIVDAGRPRCPLCGRPITDGRHFCPQSNGHSELADLT